MTTPRITFLDEKEVETAGHLWLPLSNKKSDGKGETGFRCHGGKSY